MFSCRKVEGINLNHHEGSKMVALKDPTFVREETEGFFEDDPALADPETSQLIAEAEDDLLRALVNQGVTPEEFDRTLSKNHDVILESELHSKVFGN